MKSFQSITSIRNIYKQLDFRVLPSLCSVTKCSRLFSSSARDENKICVVGSGPAGFYSAMQLLKSDTSSTVDIYDKFPIPYGLVRYGVAPDHPEVKNCITSFKKTLEKERCNFYGNVSVGEDITVSELRKCYDAVIFATGAWEDRKLGIPGEDTIGSARQFVGWYNGLPADRDLNPPLQDTEHVAIIGHGNVALDVGRILLTPVDQLRPLDIPEEVLQRLSESRVQRVTLIGRRDVVYSAFTIKEFREMTKLPGVGNDLRVEDCQHIPNVLNDVKKFKRRLMSLIHDTSLAPKEPHSKVWDMKFLRSPLQLEKTDNNLSLQLSINRMDGDKCVATGSVETLHCDMVLRSIGYLGVRFDASLPYDSNTLTLQNEEGRVNGLDGVYATGWAGSGPVGVIVNTMGQSIAVAKLLIKDLKDNNSERTVKTGSEEILSTLKEKGVRVVTTPECFKIMDEEIKRGERMGKLREKILSNEEMLELIS